MAKESQSITMSFDVVRKRKKMGECCWLSMRLLQSSSNSNSLESCWTYAGGSLSLFRDALQGSEANRVSGFRDAHYVSSGTARQDDNALDA